MYCLVNNNYFKKFERDFEVFIGIRTAGRLQSLTFLRPVALLKPNPVAPRVIERYLINV